MKRTFQSRKLPSPAREVNNFFSGHGGSVAIGIGLRDKDCNGDIPVNQPPSPRHIHLPLRNIHLHDRHCHLPDPRQRFDRLQ